MRKFTGMNYVILLPISVLTAQIMEVALRFPSNHSCSPYALVPIWLGAFVICSLASLFFRKFLWLGVAICLVGMSLVWMFDVFNIWVDYGVYCQRGQPSWGSFGTLGVSQLDMTFKARNVLIPFVIWLMLMVGGIVIGRMSVKQVEWLKNRLAVYVTLITLVSLIGFFADIARSLLCDAKWCSVYGKFLWFVCLLILSGAGSLMLRRTLLCAIVLNLTAIVCMVLCDVFNIYVMDSIWVERGRPAVGSFGLFGHHQFYPDEIGGCVLYTALLLVPALIVVDLILSFVRNKRSSCG